MRLSFHDIQQDTRPEPGLSEFRFIEGKTAPRGVCASSSGFFFVHGLATASSPQDYAVRTDSSLHAQTNLRQCGCQRTA
jgi:hypothetical protein